MLCSRLSGGHPVGTFVTEQGQLSHSAMKLFPYFSSTSKEVQSTTHFIMDQGLCLPFQTVPREFSWYGVSHQQLKFRKAALSS